MDPPRQVARHQNGSGPVFRTFKRLTPSSQKVTKQRFPTPFESEIITSQIFQCSNAPNSTVRVCQRDAPSSSVIRNHPSVDKKDSVDCNEITESIESKPGLGVPQRKHPISFELKKVSQNDGIIITNPAYNEFKDEKQLDEGGNRIKKVTLNRSKRVKMKQRPSHSEKIALPDQSENPALDELWRATALDWEPVKGTEVSYLRNMELENLPGCLQYIEEYYEILRSEAHEGYLELKKKASAETLGSGILAASRCLPPSSLLRQGGAAAKYHVEHNDLLSAVCRSGGADDRARDEIRCLHQVNDRAHSDASHSDRRARHKTRLSSMFKDDYSTFNSSSMAQHSYTAMDTDPPSQPISSDSVADSRDDILIKSDISGHNAPPCAAGIFGSRSMLRAVQSADSLISCKVKRLLTDGDSDLLKALMSKASALNSGTGAPRHPPANAAASSPRKGSHSNRPPCTKGTSEIDGDRGIEKQKPLHFLGKRGRRYTDVWNEEDFIHKTKQHHLFRAIDDWSSLVSPHSDTHDGSYRDWTNHQSALLVNKLKKGFRHFEASDMGFEYISPPVPVATVHPACWGPSARSIANSVLTKTRKKASDGNSSDCKSTYEIVHPAATCQALVEAPGHYAVMGDLEDIDDMSMHAEILVKEMLALEACNYLRLQSLQGYIAVASQIEGVRSRRTEVQAALAEMYLSDVAEKLSSARMTYSVNPDPLHASSEPPPLVYEAAYTAPVEEDPEPHTQRSVTRGMSMESIALRRQGTALEAAKSMPKPRSPSLPRHQLGALRLQDTCHGDFLAHCHQGDLVEVFSDGSWRAGCIQSLRSDGYLLRHIKVRYLGSSVGDHVWASVEDGRLAPPGTHIDIAQFRWQLVTNAPSFLHPTSLDMASINNADRERAGRSTPQCAAHIGLPSQSNTRQEDVIEAVHSADNSLSHRSVNPADGMAMEAGCPGTLDADTSCAVSNTSTRKRSICNTSAHIPPTFIGDEIVMNVNNLQCAVRSSHCSDGRSPTAAPLPPILPPCHSVWNSSEIILDTSQTKNCAASSMVAQNAGAVRSPKVHCTKSCDVLISSCSLFPSLSLTHRARARSEGELGALRGSDFNAACFAPFPSINPRPVGPTILDSAHALAALPTAAPHGMISTAASNSEISTVSPNILNDNSCGENEVESEEVLSGAGEYVRSNERQPSLSAHSAINSPLIRTVSVLTRDARTGLTQSSGAPLSRVLVTASHVQQHHHDVKGDIKWTQIEEPCWQEKMHIDRRHSVSDTSDSATDSQTFTDQRINKRERDVSLSPTNLDHRVEETARRRSTYDNDNRRSRSRSRSGSSGYHGEKDMRSKEMDWSRERREKGDRGWDRCRSRSRSRSRSHRDSGVRRGSDSARNGRKFSRRTFSRSRSRSPSGDVTPNRTRGDDAHEQNRAPAPRDYGQSRFMDMHRVGREKRESKYIEGRARDHDRDNALSSASSFSAQPSVQRSYPPVQSTFHNGQPAGPHIAMPHRPSHPYPYPAPNPPGFRAPGLTLSVSSIPNPHYHKNYSNVVLAPSVPVPPPVQANRSLSEEELLRGTSSAAQPCLQVPPQATLNDHKKNLPSFQSLYG